MPDHLSIRHVKIDSLHLDPANARTHGTENLEAIVGSLKRFGQAEPLVVQKATGRVIGGNGRMLAMQKLGWKDCDIVEVDVDDLTATALGIALNRTGELAEWNEDSLAKILYELKAKDALEGIGYGEGDAEDLFRRYGLGEGGMGEDPGPEPPPEKATTLTGDLWILGDHRLLCGDSTKAEDVARLMAGNHAALCLTDPPYGLKATGNKKAAYKLFDDQPRQVEEMAKLWLPLVRLHSTVVVFSPGITREWWYPPADWILCWFYGGGALMSRWGYNCWQPFICYGKDPSLAACRGPRPDAVNMNTPANAADLDHPCPKPLKLWLWMIERLSFNQKDIILDPFAGSGTTIVATQQLRRVSFNLELDPAYCDVALRRWEKATGKEAVLDDTGHTFAEVSMKRKTKAAEEPSPATPT